MLFAMYILIVRQTVSKPFRKTYIAEVLKVFILIVIGVFCSPNLLFILYILDKKKTSINPFLSSDWNQNKNDFFPKILFLLGFTTFLFGFTVSPRIIHKKIFFLKKLENKHIVSSDFQVKKNRNS
jgi:divalent metal cation (Fe/Co/Zn/Cd) transporter